MTMFVNKVYVLVAFTALIGVVLTDSTKEEYNIITKKLNSAPGKDSKCHDEVPYAVCTRFDSPDPLFEDNSKVSGWYFDSSNKKCKPAGRLSYTCKENQDLPKTERECIRLCTYLPCSYQWYLSNLGEFKHCRLW